MSLQDVGEGWWEGISPDGTRGLFPEAYVEVSLKLVSIPLIVFMTTRSTIS